jgi:acyl-CoA thioester hydrolase
MRIALQPSLDPSDYPFSHALRVRFGETDAMGITHHASYIAYLEQARVEYLRWAGHPYHELRTHGVELPVLELFLQYVRPTLFDDEITLYVMVGAIARATFQVGYLLTVDGSPVMTAVTAHGAVTKDGRATRLPEWVADLGPALATS